jgi:hypothetical protein
MQPNENYMLGMKFLFRPNNSRVLSDNENKYNFLTFSLFI